MKFSLIFQHNFLILKMIDRGKMSAFRESFKLLKKNRAVAIDRLDRYMEETRLKKGE